MKESNKMPVQSVERFDVELDRLPSERFQHSVCMPSASCTSAHHLHLFRSPYGNPAAFSCLTLSIHALALV